MLQHNAAGIGRRAHVAHATVVAFHAVCCGLPILAMLAAGLTGATAGSALLSDTWREFHGLLHENEVWIVALSAVLVAFGAALEVLERRGRAQTRFPWMFALSVACFAANAAIVLAHRAG